MEKAKKCLKLIFVHVGKSSILRAELIKTSRTVHNADINFRRHLCNVADDASPVEDGSAEQKLILIAVFARGLHDDALPDKLTFCVLGAQIHLPTPASQRSEKDWGHAAAQEFVIGLIISVRSGSERPMIDM